MNIKKAPRIIEGLMRRFSVAVIVNPLTKSAYFRSDHWPPPDRLLCHEETHIRQIERWEQKWGRFGRLAFILDYLWQSIRHGYRNNPYEVEARTMESGTEE